LHYARPLVYAVDHFRLGNLREFNENTKNFTNLVTIPTTAKLAANMVEEALY